MSSNASLGVDKEVPLYVLCGVILVQKPLVPSTESRSRVSCVMLVHILCILKYSAWCKRTAVELPQIGFRFEVLHPSEIEKVNVF